MVFSSIPFIFYFLPMLLAAYFIVPARFRTIRNLILLTGSLIFYAWGEGRYIIVLIVSVFINHFIAKKLAQSYSKSTLAIGIFINLFILGFYKYAGFLTATIGITDWNVPRLPLGISFFTFQAISFLIDTYRKDAPTTKSLINTALYICSFPQLIAGPIVRYKDIAAQIIERTESIEKFSLGIKIFVIGLSQKILIANTVGEIADQTFATQTSVLGTLEAWYGLIAYGLQIYFDFAGYSNMAIGLGYLMGFRFPKNFNAPYSSQSVTEFWRRWHMTLSNWFRDYLYIPLGGNRESTSKTIFNLWCVFLLCGFWHGASWTFILWGAWHGFFLSIERLGLSQVLQRSWRPLRHLYLILIVLLGWVLFRADSTHHAIELYQVLFGLSLASGKANLLLINSHMVMFMVVAFFLSTNYASILGDRLFNLKSQKTENVCHKNNNYISYFLILGLFLLCTAFIQGDSYNPFIYFRF